MISRGLLAGYLLTYELGRLHNSKQTERGGNVMNQQTPDQGWQQLREIIDGLFEHVLRKEKENAILSASRMAVNDERSCMPSRDAQRWGKAYDQAANSAPSP